MLNLRNHINDTTSLDTLRQKQKKDKIYQELSKCIELEKVFCGFIITYNGISHTDTKFSKIHVCCEDVSKVHLCCKDVFGENIVWYFCDHDDNFVYIGPMMTLDEVFKKLKQ